jgi:hypothetical protein
MNYLILVLIATIATNWLSAEPNTEITDEVTVEVKYLDRKGLQNDKLSKEFTDFFDKVSKNYTASVLDDLKGSSIDCFTFIGIQGLKKGDTSVLTFTRELFNPEGDIYQRSHKIPIERENGFVIHGIEGIGFLPGEAIDCEFKSLKTGKILYNSKIIPQPIHVLSSKGNFSCDVELIAVVPLTMYDIKLSGLKDGEILDLYSKSGSEKMNYPLRFTSNMGFSYTPDSDGKKKGTATIKFTRSDGEFLQAILPWGTETIDYLSGKFIYSPEGPKKVKGLNSTNGK